MVKEGDIQLQYVRQEISRQVDFPEELASSFDKSSADQLLSAVNGCQNKQELITLTYSLSRKSLNGLFAAVLRIPEPDTADSFVRLLEIFRLRATVSLAQAAWAFYQRYYPHERLTQVLELLLETLHSKKELPDYLQEVHKIPLDDLFPYQLARHCSKLVDLELQPDASGKVPVAQLRDKYPLLASYTSLVNLPLDQQDGSCINSSLCGYMVRLFILPDTAFTATFLLGWFSDATENDIRENANLFVQALRTGRLSYQICLLQNYLRGHRLGQSWQEINQTILELFGIPEKVQPVGEEASPPAVKKEESSRPEPAQAAAPSQARPSFWRRLLRRKKPPLAEPVPVVSLPQPPEKKEVTAPAAEKPDPAQIFRDCLRPNTWLEEPIWQHLDSRQVMLFRQWALLDQLAGHGEANQRKQMFYQRYASWINKISKWDEDTLLVEMNGFYLVDKQSEPEQVWYYDQVTLVLLAKSGYGQKPLGQPAREAVSSREVLLQDISQNIVLLPLDGVNLLYAHDFMRHIQDRQGPEQA